MAAYGLGCELTQPMAHLFYHPSRLRHSRNQNQAHLSGFNMDLPILKDAAALLARHLLGEPVCVLPVNPQVALDFAREGALRTLPQLIVLKLSLTAIMRGISSPCLI